MSALAADDPKNLDAKALENMLRGVGDRIADGLKVISAGTRQGTARWRVVSGGFEVAS